MTRGALARALLLALLPLLLCGAARLRLDGIQIERAVPAWDIEGVRYYELDSLAAALELKLVAHPQTGRSSLARGTSRLALAPGLHSVLLDGQVFELKNAPRIVQGRLAVPEELFVPLGRLLGATLEPATFQSDPRPDQAELAAALQPAALRRVVLDPGHGGEDPGAMGPDGQAEKDVTLAVALLAKPLIERELGCEVLLTRGADVFVPLAERTRLANMWGADLFVSIHANGARRVEAAGVETYYLALNPSDSFAAETAADENSVLRLEGGPAPEALDDLQAILWDMVQTEVLQASSEVAELAQQRLTQVADGPNRGVKQAPFFVLIGTQMPAILIEVGFITNPAEAQRLSRGATQLELAKALALAVTDYDERLRNGE